jgi:AraC-like DNA-binding protein
MKNIPIRQINSHCLNCPSNFNIRDVRELIDGKDLIQPLHRHDFFYVLALEKGKGDHRIDFQSYKIRDNSVFFMRPGQVHEIVLKAGSSGYLMEFNRDFYAPLDMNSQQLLRKASGVNFYQLRAGSGKRVGAIFKTIIGEYRYKAEGFQEVVRANMSILLVELARQQPEDASATSVGYAHQRLQAFLELVEKRVGDQIEVSAYADQLSLSVYQLNAITKRTLGKTASEIISEQMILESKRHLLATANQVSQIADRLGYHDVSYFIRFFKKHTGYSPEAFRVNFK